VRCGIKLVEAKQHQHLGSSMARSSGGGVALDPTRHANLGVEWEHSVFSITNDVKPCGHVHCDRAILASCQVATTVDEVFDVFLNSPVFVEHKKKIWSIRYGITEFVFSKPEKFQESRRKEIIARLKEYTDGFASATRPAKLRRQLSKHSYYQRIDGVNLDSEVVNTCHDAAASGPISLENAKKVWDQLIDYDTVTNAECWTLRYCLTEFNWQKDAFDWIFAQFPGRPEKDLPGKNSDMDLSPPPSLIDHISDAIDRRHSKYFPEPEEIVTEEAPATWMPTISLLIVVVLLGITIWRKLSSSILCTIFILVFVSAKLDAKFWPDWKRWWL